MLEVKNEKWEHYLSVILRRASFGQHQESRLLGWFNNLGQLYLNIGELKHAKERFANEVWRRSSCCSKFFIKFGRYLLHTRQYKLAKEHHKKALMISEKRTNFGEKNEAVAKVCYKVGNVYVSICK